MNVIVANKQQNELANLDIDIIKSLTGTYNASELVEMFKSFFYSKMILDVTALIDADQLGTYEILAKGLDPSKIIFLLPEGSNLCTPSFLSRLISFGIYNFTTNLNGVKYLLKKSNSLSDVEHIQKMAKTEESKSIEDGNKSTTIGNSNTNVKASKVNSTRKIIGFKSVTEHAGSTTLIYMLRKELSSVYGRDGAIALEIDKNDFGLFNDKNMISVKMNDIKNAIEKYSDANVILIDLNNCTDDSFCNDVIYLIEPSTIKLNKLVRKNKLIFSKLTDKKVVLNNSLLLNNDVFDFEGEAGVKVFYNLPPLDERKKNAILVDFLTKLGLVESSNTNNNSNKIFGLFRR